MIGLTGGFIAKLRRNDCVNDRVLLVLACCDQVAESLARISLFGRNGLSRIVLLYLITLEYEITCVTKSVLFTIHGRIKL